ncbi:MAG: UbiD family decarboxylase [Spirochaetota bacterium]
MNLIRSTQDLVTILRQEKEILEITEEVDPDQELAEIQRRVVAKKGPALLFHNVKGSSFPVATNLYGSERRINLAFGKRPLQLVEQIAETAQNLMPPDFKKIWQSRNLAWEALRVGTKKQKKAAVLAGETKEVDLHQLPALKSWPEDGGRFITLPLVYTQSPISGKGNLGMYRIQIHDRTTTGMHIQIHRGGGFHHFEAKQKNMALPAHIYVGGPPALTLAAIAPMPEEMSELVIASLLLGEKLRLYRNPQVSPLPIVADADFLLVGEIPAEEMRAEGPFGDHYGYYALQHDYPVFRTKRMFHRQGAIWPATVVGRPPQEDHYIAEYLQDLLSPMFPLVMPKVVSVWAYEESGVHTLAAAVVRERYHKEAFTAALRILGEGHLSLSKCLFVTNKECNLKDFTSTFVTILERANLATDLHIFANVSQDTLDYTSKQVNKGSKMLLLGIGEKKNELKTDFSGRFVSPSFSKPIVFCPGVLLVQGDSYSSSNALAEVLLQEQAIEGFQMVFLVDNSQEASKSAHDFLWHIFTRFEPAGDIYAKYSVQKNHIAYRNPIVIDCRLKDWFPKVLQEDQTVVERVEQRFGKLIASL